MPEAGTDADREPNRNEFIDQYRDTSPEVFAYLRRATGNDRALTEDLTADVYLKAMEAWRGGNPNAVTLPWLITTARNRFIDHLRRAEVEQRKLALVHAAEPETIDDDFAGIEARVLLGAARQLPPMQRAVLALRYVDDLTVNEVAFQLDRSVDSVDALLRRARNNLRTLITDTEDTP